MTKEDERMGRITVEVEVVNMVDEGMAARAVIPLQQVRRVVATALVDTGATLLVMPEDMVEQLGLPILRHARTRLGDGRVVDCTIHSGAKLTVMRRAVTTDVLKAPRGVPVLLGQIPLEGLDLHIDPKHQRLMPNPEAPDPETVLVDLYAAQPD
jgi:clan AA aspartic protease